MVADYLRKQANKCLNWARECFDLETATRLRVLAGELRAKADEIDAGNASPTRMPQQTRP